MVSSHILRIVTLLVFSLLVGCDQSTSISGKNITHAWHSKYHPVEATLAKGWMKTYMRQPGDTCDTPEKLNMAFVNKEAKSGCVLRIEKDVPLEQLSNENYIDVVKQQYSENPTYRLESEDTVTLYGKEFHWLRFLLVGSKGPVCTDYYVYRDGRISITIQWSFPASLSGPVEIPAVVRDFRRSLRMFDETR